MSNLKNEMLAKLTEIEAEMKKIKFSFEDETNVQGTFKHWLQFTFIPNARKFVETGDLPKESQVGLMALRQYDYHSVIEDAHPLMKMLFEFDKMIERHWQDKSKNSP